LLLPILRLFLCKQKHPKGQAVGSSLYPVQTANHTSASAPPSECLADFVFVFLFLTIRTGESGLLLVRHQLLICTVEILKKNSGECLPRSGESVGCSLGKYKVFDPNESMREPIYSHFQGGCQKQGMYHCVLRKSAGSPMLCLVLNRYFSLRLEMLTRASMHKTIVDKNSTTLF